MQISREELGSGEDGGGEHGADEEAFEGDCYGGEDDDGDEPEDEVAAYCDAEVDLEGVLGGVREGRWLNIL